MGGPVRYPLRVCSGGRVDGVATGADSVPIHLPQRGKTMGRHDETSFTTGTMRRDMTYTRETLRCLEECISRRDWEKFAELSNELSALWASHADDAESRISADSDYWHYR